MNSIGFFAAKFLPSLVFLVRARGGVRIGRVVGADVHFEAFQMSDVCVRLFKEGWFETEIKEDDDPKLSKMKKDVVVGVKDTREVDNDFFLVVVKIADHQVCMVPCNSFFDFMSM